MSDSQRQFESEQREIDRLRDAFGRAWNAGQHPRIEDFLNQVDVRLRDQLLRELLSIELQRRIDDGEDPRTQDYEDRFPDQQLAISSAFASNRPRSSSATDSTVDVPGGSDVSDGFEVTGEVTDLVELGRFSVQHRLGGGSFGSVYLAHDPQLDRLVALKIPEKKSFSSARALVEFLDEARTAAQLKHPGLVAVHDIRQSEDGVPFIVSEFIDGTNLSSWMKNNSATPQQAVSLVVEIAEAISYAHQQGFIHRDIKPANVLIDLNGHPHVADFGLALHESLQRHRRGESVGTPAYMSPELVRGESHRLDGRSDIWSLGVIMYELLTRRRPFGGDSREELYDEIQNREPRPLRQWKPRISPELDRICMRCLAKRMTDRYGSAASLLEDLQHWLRHGDTTQQPSDRAKRISFASSPKVFAHLTKMTRTFTCIFCPVHATATGSRPASCSGSIALKKRTAITHFPSASFMALAAAESHRL